MAKIHTLTGLSVRVVGVTIAVECDEDTKRAKLVIRDPLDGLTPVQREAVSVACRQLRQRARRFLVGWRIEP